MRIEYLDGANRGRVVWDNGTLVWRWTPGRKRMTIARCRRGSDVLDPRREALILKNFVPHLAGAESIAGRPAHIVDLHPKQAEVGWKRIWVDDVCYAVLAATDYSADSQPLRSTRFEQVVVDAPADPKGFQPPMDLVVKYGAPKVADNFPGYQPEELSRVVDFPIRLPTHLPPGYEWEVGFPYPCECGREAARLQYTNGLDTLVLFECGHTCPDGKECLIPQGSPSSVVRLHAKDLSLAVVGESSRGELEKMLQSVVSAKPVVVNR